MVETLSKAQRDLLRETAIGSGVKCVKAYRPARKLVTLGLAEWLRDDEYSGTLVATSQGRAAIAALKADL